MWRALVVLKIIYEDKDESTFSFAHVHFIVVTENFFLKYRTYIIYVAKW